ncbi:Oxysterol-binding protein-related protein 1 [Liparis tanakae]|uniref:Oxysterol-binding protein-related protein 1 n=1 Tax=Liparis tanakae TaxID=230148 RepID=A0A4Z2FLX9_9TELE|nr:Oxysterol-binding protein-related protein 1 [Liparis tanakae]
MTRSVTCRQEVVMLLLRYDASAAVINGTAQIPKDVTQHAEIRGMLEAAERTEERKLEEELLEAAREGDLPTLTQLLSRTKTPNIQCSDLLGNTPLHCAAYRGQRQCALRLLRSGAGAHLRNKKGTGPQPRATPTHRTTKGPLEPHKGSSEGRQRRTIYGSTKNLSNQGSLKNHFLKEFFNEPIKVS